MSVENTKVIDAISIDLNGHAVLTISDHLEWDANNEHLLILQEKINTYLSVIESGELYALYPKAKNRTIVINVALKHPPDMIAKDFFIKTKDMVENAGYVFNYRLLQ